MALWEPSIQKEETAIYIKDFSLGLRAGLLRVELGRSGGNELEGGGVESFWII